MNLPLTSISEDDIAVYLAKNPDFFERHAHALTSVQLTSPHGARAVSLQERQAEMLRDKIKGHEQRIVEFVRNSADNSTIAKKVHDWTSDLLKIKDPIVLPQAVVEGLRTLFDVPLAAVRIWDVAPPYMGASFTHGASEDARAFASSLTMPFCGPNLGFEPAGWLSGRQGEMAQSLALLPLREGAIDSATPAFGLLVLGSTDAYRFEATMGVDFLSRMAELASAALLRLR